MNYKLYSTALSNYKKWADSNIVAVSDAKQLEKIKKEASSLKAIRDELKFWDYNDVLKVFDSLSNAYESINSLGLVPSGLF